jgi:hypothetical protein
MTYVRTSPHISELPNKRFVLMLLAAAAAENRQMVETQQKFLSTL